MRVPLVRKKRNSKKGKGRRGEGERERQRQRQTGRQADRQTNR